MQFNPAMSDVDMLIDLEKDTRLAAVAYLSTAGEAHDPTLKDLFFDFSKGSMKHQEKCLDLIKKMGGDI
ncbi:MAG TPA: hypothetical protein VHQ46_05845 [Desulfobacteria bacterium]|nr:hypothetical protein [Desulfobacteria bacterium]